LMVDSYYDDQDSNNVEKYRQLQDKINQMQLDKALEALSKPQVAAKRAA